MLSKRERRPVDDISSPQQKSQIAYRRTSIPSVQSLSSSPASLFPSSLFSRRAPLAPFHPQISTLQPLDNQMPPSADPQTPTIIAYPSQDNSTDTKRLPDLPKHGLGKYITTNRSLDDDPLPSPPRKRSISGLSTPPPSRTLPYPPPRLQQRRPSNTPSASVSAPRRPSVPGPHPQHTYPPPRNSSLDPKASVPPPLQSIDNDLYSGLTSYSFGTGTAPPPPINTHTSDQTDLISPLTRLYNSSSTTPTPRPSLSGPSGTPKHHPLPSPSFPKQQQRSTQFQRDLPDPPDFGDDELEDEEDAARHRRRSKMRAIDDGSRRPSLPTNVYPPVPTTTNNGSKASSSSPPPHGTTSPSSPSDQSTIDSEADPEDPDQADFDTDVEFDPPLPDNASQHTFGGGGGFDHYGYRHSMRSDVTSIRDDFDDDGDYHYRGDSTSPVAFTRHHYDGEGPDVDTLHIGPSSASSSRFSRRGSMPLKIPNPASPRDREDSMATITAGRRPSRSYEDGSKMPQLNVQPSSLPETRSGLAGLGESSGDGDEENSGPPVTQEPETNVYEGLDVDYILSGPVDNLRRSWSSGAPSYVAKDRMRSLGNLAEGGNMGESLSWMWSGPEGRRPSTITVLSTPGEDVFTRHLRKNDINYNVRRMEWSFKKESTDGMGPRLPPGPGGEEGELRRMMEPGMQEIWRHAYIGRFKVDRLLIRSDQPDKPPQQRVNIRHIIDPFSKGNPHGGPSSVIHKHSRAAAFSIFRTHSLFKKAAAAQGNHMSTSISILLATRRVQEQYTSTRTTSKLNTYGLLEDKPRKHDSRSQSTAQSTSTTSNISRASSSRQPEGRPRDKGKPSRGKPSDDTESDMGQSSQTRSGASGWSVQTGTSENVQMQNISPPRPSPPPPSSVPSSPTLHHGHGHAFSSVSESTTTTYRVSRAESIHRQPTISERTTSLPSSSDSALNRSDSSRTLDDTVEMEDEEQSPPRTSHAEAFATVDSNYLEYVRGKAEHRAPEHDSSSQHLFGALRRKLLGQGAAKSSPKPHVGGPAGAQLEGFYQPPWVTMASRSKQEERERVIQTLNESFKDVGLLPSFRSQKNGQTKRKNKKSKDRADVFGPGLGDCLYMLLPLWPGETDPVSRERDEDPEMYIVPVTERQYLLVYYAPFGENTKKKGDKKRTRAETQATSSTGAPGSNISLQSFRVCAKLVNYMDMRETGVRLPDCGLSVTGSMVEAKQLLPPSSIREMALDDIVIGICSMRDSGMEILPEGLVKLGLAIPADVPTPTPLTREEDEVPELDVMLTPIGRAAVEMAWLGCMAVTCFDLSSS